MTVTTSVGKEAERLVAEHLKSEKFKILEMNWRRPRCEIDIIALNDKVIYFVEVKFRSSAFQGDGLEYVTARKLKQVEFAARVWTQENNWSGDYRILAASVERDGDMMLIREIIEVS